MKNVLIIGLFTVVGIVFWLSQNQSNQASQDDKKQEDLQEVSNRLEKEIDPNGPAPQLFIEQSSKLKDDKQKSTKPRTNVIPTQPSAETKKKRDLPEARTQDGKVNPDAIEYYRKKGFLGAKVETLAVLESQPDIWKADPKNPLRFEQVGGGLDLTFETDKEEQINGASINITGGGGGARLMTIEMLMTGMENPWELYWETMRPGPIAGTVPTPDGQEVHYYCDMVSMDPSGSLNQPSQCHFLLNQPTPELLNYLQNKDAEPIQKARSRIEP